MPGQPPAALSCTHPTTPSRPEDVALGYWQLAEIENAFRTTSDLVRPLDHQIEDRIQAHVLFYWLAVLLVRVVKRETGHRWPAVRREMQRLHRITHGGPHGEVSQRPVFRPKS